MRFLIIIAYVLNTIGVIESRNLQIAHIKNVTVDSCGLKSLREKQATNTHQSCFKWHKTILEQRNALKRIEYGSDAEIGEFPYTVLIMAKTHNTSGKCTGAIINPIWIITAAHCISKFSINDIRVYSGITDYTQSSITFNGANRAIAHESYNHTDYYGRFYDIGLIKVTKRINLNTAKANSVCLPATEFKIDGEELATFSGWGFINDYLPNMRRLKKTIIKLNLKYDINHIAIVTDKIIEGKPCDGDSGGPLVQYVNGRAVLIGVLFSTWHSAGKPCGNISRIYFSSVPFHMNWIINTIKNN